MTPEKALADPTEDSPPPHVVPTIAEQLGTVGIAGCETVRAFTINPGDKRAAGSQVGIIDAHLNPRRLPRNGVELSAAQVAEFLHAAAASEHPGPHAWCFYPHHTLVFFGPEDRLIGHYTICFTCFGHKSSVGKFAEEPDYKALQNLMQALKLPRQ